MCSLFSDIVSLIMNIGALLHYMSTTPKLIHSQIYINIYIYIIVLHMLAFKYIFFLQWYIRIHFMSMKNITICSYSYYIFVYVNVYVDIFDLICLIVRVNHYDT